MVRNIWVVWSTTSSQDCMWATKIFHSPFNTITVKRSNPFQQVYQHLVNNCLMERCVEIKWNMKITWQFDSLWGTASVAHPIPSHIHVWEYIANQPMLDHAGRTKFLCKQHMKKIFCLVGYIFPMVYVGNQRKINDESLVVNLRK